MFLLLSRQDLAVWRNYEDALDLKVSGETLLVTTSSGAVALPHVFPEEGLKASVQRIDPTRSWTDQVRDLVAPPAPAYCLLRFANTCLAGTANGLYQWGKESWVRKALPSKSPLKRANGITRFGDRYVVGGLGGLYIGYPGAWQQVAPDSIRQVVKIDGYAWIVHGSGAVDKLDPIKARLFPDVLAGQASRPWTSCVGSSGNTVLLGGSGGWCERSAKNIDCFDQALDGDVVTAIEGEGARRWVGTQKNGLIEITRKGKKFWNPGNGLVDTWVTALARCPRGLYIGTHSGLFLLANGRMNGLPSPTSRITALKVTQGKLFIGGMDGAWVQSPLGTKALPTHGEETTSITVEGRNLMLTTSQGIYFLAIDRA